jgi:hemoglobin/transferrin/lactoferrin receptor protein
MRDQSGSCSILLGKPLAAAIALALAIPFPALADDLGSVSVTATRSDSHLSDVPASVSEVSRDDIDERQANAVGDVLGDLPGVDFGGGPRPTGQIPTIRGQYGNQIITLVDGARINDPNDDGILSSLVIDPDMLENIDVVRGSTSSLYGSGGMGGVMSFHTLSALDLLRDGQNFGAEVKTGGATADESTHFHARLYGRNGPVDGLVAVTRRDWGPIQQGDGKVLEPNDGRSDSVLAKVGLQASDRLRFELSHQYFSEKALMPNNPQANSSFPMDQENKIRQSEDVANMFLLAPNGERSVTGTLYRTVTDRSALANPAASLPATSSDNKTLGGSLQHNLQLNRQRITYGLDAYRDKQRALSAGLPNSVLPDGNQSAYGVFAQDEIELNSRWRLVPSARWDHFSTHRQDGSSPDTDSAHVSPKLALLWQATPSLSLYSSYGEAFRAPTLNEMYQNLSGNQYFANFAPNTNLKPETARTWEIGSRYERHDLLAADDRASFTASVYRERVDNLIESAMIGTYVNPFIGPRPILQDQNVSKAKRWGIELAGDYGRGDWNLHAAYTRMRAEDAETGANLFSPPDQFNLQMRYWLGSHDLSVLWSSTATAAQDYDSTVLRRRDGWVRHDLFLTWTPSTAVRVDFGIRNLTDKRYASYQSANAYAMTYEQGRSFTATLTWRL